MDAADCVMVRRALHDLVAHAGAASSICLRDTICGALTCLEIIGITFLAALQSRLSSRRFTAVATLQLHLQLCGSGPTVAAVAIFILGMERHTTKNKKLSSVLGWSGQGQSARFPTELSMVVFVATHPWDTTSLFSQCCETCMAMSLSAVSLVL
jgi:hypothetical protein